MAELNDILVFRAFVVLVGLTWLSGASEDLWVFLRMRMRASPSPAVALGGELLDLSLMWGAPYWGHLVVLVGRVWPEGTGWSLGSSWHATDFSFWLGIRKHHTWPLGPPGGAWKVPTPHHLSSPGVPDHPTQDISGILLSLPLLFPGFAPVLGKEEQRLSGFLLGAHPLMSLWKWTLAGLFAILGTLTCWDPCVIGLFRAEVHECSRPEEHECLGGSLSGSP